MTADWWRGAVIYQIYPRSFFDMTGTGIGDLPGVTQKLEYIADLGVDGIWLSPFFTSPMKDFGYDVADYRDVDPIFGTLRDFDTLLEKAHDVGLKVIIDQVYSHTSDQHPWFKESRESRYGPMADWYTWADPKPDGTPPNNWLSVFGGPAWRWDTQRRQYYLHSFLAEQPDLNFNNPAVHREVLDVARFWLDRGVDGFRLDVANYYYHDVELRDNPPIGTIGHVRPAQFQRHLYVRSRPETLVFVEEFRALLDQYPDRMCVAEIDSSNPTTRAVEYTLGENRLHTAYNFQFLRSETLTPSLIREELEQWQRAEAWPSWAFSNHDVVRAVTRWGGAEPTQAFAKQLLMLLTCLRGTVFLYQGDELGLPQANVAFEDLQDPEAIRFWPNNLGRDGARTPIPWIGAAHHGQFTLGTPWLPVDEAHLPLAVDHQEEDAFSTLNFCRALLRQRKGTPTLVKGTLHFQDAPEPLLVFDRQLGEDHLRCFFNLSDAPVVTTAPTFSEILPIDLGGVVNGDTLYLPPHGALVGRIG